MTLTRNLEVIASDTENAGLLTIGVMVDGAFYTLGAYKEGSHEQRKNVPTALAHAEEEKSQDQPPAAPTG